MVIGEIKYLNASKIKIGSNKQQRNRVKLIRIAKIIKVGGCRGGKLHKGGIVAVGIFAGGNVVVGNVEVGNDV